ECAARLLTLRRTIDLLRHVGRTEPLPPGFKEALHRRLATVPPPAPAFSARLWQFLEVLRLDSAPRLGMALGVTALLFSLAVPGIRAGGGEAVSGGGGNGPGAAATSELEVAAAFRVPQQRIAVVRFDFVADVEVMDVEFEVTLPSELNFIDEGKVLE